MFIKINSLIMYLDHLTAFTWFIIIHLVRTRITQKQNYSLFKLQWIQTLKLKESDVYFAFVYISGVKLQKLEWAIFKYYQQAEYEIVTFFKVNNE